MNSNDLELRKRQLKKWLLLDKCKTDYFAFLKYLFQNKDVTWNWHHKYACGVLQEFVEGKHSNLMIFMPPQHQKSTMLVEFLVPYALGINPNEQIILTMYNQTKAAEYNRKIQRVITDEKYYEIFPDTRLNDRNVVTDAKGHYVRNSEKFEVVNKQGFLYAVGVSGGIAGTPAKMALMDDVIKNYEEAYSPTYRNRVYNWYTDELEARLHNDSRVAFTITRRHMDDLAGRLLDRDGTVEEGGKWKVVTIPAIKETNENADDPRKIGEALFPQLHSLERLEEIRDKNPRTFASLYQQRPAPTEGAIIKREWFKSYDKTSVNINNLRSKTRIYIDGAYTSNKANDPSAIVVYAMINRKVHILRSFQEWLEAPELLKRIQEIIATYGNEKYTRVMFEPKASGKTLKQILASSGILAKEDKAPTESKVTRVEVITPFLERGEVLLPSNEADQTWVNAFIDECITFPSGRDDQVDCLSAICRIELATAPAIQWNQSTVRI